MENNLNSKKFTSDIMDFQLQCTLVRLWVRVFVSGRIRQMDTGRNYRTCTIIHYQSQKL